MLVEETLTQMQRLLTRRGQMRLAVNVALASASAAAASAIFWALGIAPYWLPWAAALAAAVAAAVISYRRPPALPQVALFLDLRCNLQERLSAFISPGRSRFLSALAADLEMRLKKSDLQPAIGPSLPPHGTLLAAPIAVLTAIILLSAENQPAPPPARSAAPMPAPQPNAATRLALLWRHLQEAKRRYEATRSEADRLAMEQAQKAWEQELARWRFANLGQRSKTAAGDGPASLPAPGGDLALLRVSERIAGKSSADGVGISAKRQGPDWRTFAPVEECIPLAWRPGFRAYFDAIASEALQREVETQIGGRP
ncbi:MAG: hypothetical protein N3A66_00655 [Planctomycetota bacterium]|nr:hypothetical protein [Planctomycetota bacterium]